ncbi:MAG: peptide chain release factor N(5)-glutamine methyltransferase [Eubacteriales bacterium]|nr:peptide chain release factor N(5)-glutamine methyltransferase [Eubacteriales bacterium]MDD4475634.1 peptide chain release factor N(5)-glutamine methyltransferase [Eubacteriales bacterium]
MTVSDLRKNIKKSLEEYMVDEADIIGDIVVASSLGTTRSTLYLMLDKEVSPADFAKAEDMVKKLMTGMPVQYVLGECYFYGLPIKIGAGCFIPRSDTELLVTEAIKLLPKGGKFADICTGSGCIAKAIATKRPDCTGLSLDYYPRPLSTAEINLADCPNVKVERFDALEPDDYRRLYGFDLIVCNPPYIPSEDLQFLDTNVQFEPETALDGGEDGLKFYRAVSEYGSQCLKNSGAILFEAGIHQAEDISALLQSQGFKTYTKDDLGGIPRLIAGVKMGGNE